MLHASKLLLGAGVLAFVAAAAPAQMAENNLAGITTSQNDGTTRTANEAVDEGTKSDIRASLERARATFTAGNQLEAAKHVNEAITLLRTEAGREEGDAGDDLRAAIDRLGKLAGQLEKQEVKDVSDFKDAYTDAYDRLAWYHYERAEKMYAERNRNRSDATGNAGLTEEQIRERNAARRENMREAREARLDAERDAEREAAHDQREQRHEARHDDVNTTESWNERMGYHLRESTENFGAWASESGAKVGDNTRGLGTRLKGWTGAAIKGTGNVTENVGETLNKWGDEMRQYGSGVQRRAKTQTTTTTTESTRQE